MVIGQHVAQSYGDTGGAWLVFDKEQVPFLGHFLFFLMLLTLWRCISLFRGILPSKV